MSGRASEYLRALGDVFLPRRCPVCGRELLRHEGRLCLPCAADLPLTHLWLLPRNPMADRFNARLLEEAEGEGVGNARQPVAGPGTICRRCEKEVVTSDANPASVPSSVAGPAPEIAPATNPGETCDNPPGSCRERYVFAAALFYYRSEAGYSAITKALKYHADFGMGRHFATELGRKLASSEAFRDVTAVVPVPLHPWRRWRRGYNQAAVIARCVAAELGVPVRKSLLRRRRYTRTQTRLTREQKERNVAGAFAPTRRARKHPPVGEGAHLLLIDDVYTTGATLRACYRVLHALFPSARISIATLAVVQE